MPRLAALLASLSESDDIAYVLGPDLCIVAKNPGWTHFALANGASAGLQRWEFGRAPVDEAMPEPLRAFYVGAFTRALATGERWEHDYECNSPELHRRFHMVAYPVEGCFLVVVHSLRVEAPHNRAVFAPDDATYAASGVVVMCSHCRRVRNPAGRLRWDWVPEYLRLPPPTLSHGLCEPCYAFYWDGLEDRP